MTSLRLPQEVEFVGEAERRERFHSQPQLTEVGGKISVEMDWDLAEDLELSQSPQRSDCSLAPLVEGMFVKCERRGYSVHCPNERPFLHRSHLSGQTWQRHLRREAGDVQSNSQMFRDASRDNNSGHHPCAQRRWHLGNQQRQYFYFLPQGSTVSFVAHQKSEGKFPFGHSSQPQPQHWDQSLSSRDLHLETSLNDSNKTHFVKCWHSIRWD